MANRLKTQIEFSVDQPTIKLEQVNEKKFEECYELFETLGQGAHAIVKLAKHKETKQTYAVKILRSGDQEIQNNVKRTFNNTRCLRHQNIAQDYDLYINEQNETSFLIMEYCSFPSLESILKVRPLSQEELKVVIKQLLQAIQHAHSKGICHRDIKPDNILVNLSEDSKPPHVKVIDFGVSRRFISKGQLTDMLTKTGNIFYCAPEIYHQNNYSYQVDIWAIGVILYQCIFQKLPLHSNSTSDFVDLLAHPEQWKFYEELKSLDLPLQNLLLSMLQPKVEERISIDEALQHPFFEIGTIRDVMALLNNIKLDDDDCRRCRSLQNSLQITDQWGYVMKKLQNSQNDEEDVVIDNLVKDIGNIHVIQKHGERCGLIQLMNSIGNSSNAFLSKLGSRQDLLDKSLQFCGSSNKIIHHQDMFSDVCHIQSSLEMKVDQQTTKMFSQLGAHLEKSIDTTDFAQSQSKSNDQQYQRGQSLIRGMFNDLGIKEVDEITEDQM